MLKYLKNLFKLKINISQLLSLVNNNLNCMRKARRHFHYILKGIFPAIMLFTLDRDNNSLLFENYSNCTIESISTIEIWLRLRATQEEEEEEKVLKHLRSKFPSIYIFYARMKLQLKLHTQKRGEWRRIMSSKYRIHLDDRVKRTLIFCRTQHNECSFCCSTQIHCIAVDVRG